jgi:hypothetical protein
MTDYVAMTKANGRGDHRQVPLMSASLRDAKSGALMAGADPRRDGYALPF